MADDNRIYLFDSTLRDGAQTQGVDFSVADKAAIPARWTGLASITSKAAGRAPTRRTMLFSVIRRSLNWQVTAFGMTRRLAGRSKTIPGLLPCSTPSQCRLHGRQDLELSCRCRAGDPARRKRGDDFRFHRYGKQRVGEVLFDAEHFFDGYKASPEYALSCVKAAYEAGARWVVLCDTNGGTLPHEIDRIIRDVAEHVPGTHLGIHCHNDTENAVANSLAAVNAGARQIQEL